MKFENSIEVKHVSHLSVAYLTRFFGSVGTVVNIQKDEISKYVTIEFGNPRSVDKAFRFAGRVLDTRPIKIRKCRDQVESQRKQSIELRREQGRSPLLNLSQHLSSSLVTVNDLWALIEQEIRPHLFEQNQQKLISMFVCGLTDLLMNSAKHRRKFKVNMRSKYLLLEIQKIIIQKIARKSINVVGVAQKHKTILEWRDCEALVWFTVPFPNIQQEQCKIESTSSMTKCVQTIKHGLSLRLAQIISALHSASLCSNLEQTNSEELLSLAPVIRTSQEDNFIGSVDNYGTKNMFYQFCNYQQPNTCLYLKKDNSLRMFECTLMLHGCDNQQFQDTSWCHIYQGQLIKRTLAGIIEYEIVRVQKIERTQMRNRVLVFQNGNFSLQSVEEQLAAYQEIFSEEAITFYITKEVRTEKTHEFKKVYEDDFMKIEEEVEQIQSIQKTSKTSEKRSQFPENIQLITNLILIELKDENSSLFNNLKLTHYLQTYIQNSIVAKGLIVASREMAIKLAANIIDRQKDNRLFWFRDKKYDQFIGEQLWRLYSKQGERKIKSLLSKYTRAKS